MLLHDWLFSPIRMASIIHSDTTKPIVVALSSTRLTSASSSSMPLSSSSVPLIIPDHHPILPKRARLQLQLQLKSASAFSLSGSMARLPLVIHSSIFANLSLADFINLSVTHPYLHKISLMSSSHHPGWGIFGMRCLTPANQGVWLRRLVPYGVTSLDLRDRHGVFDIPDMIQKVLVGMSSTLRSLSIFFIASNVLIQLTSLTSLSVYRWRKEDDMKALLSLPLLQHYSDWNTENDREDPPLRHIDWLPSTLTSLELPQCHISS
jgi:hypothetical protein